MDDFGLDWDDISIQLSKAGTEYVLGPGSVALLISKGYD